LAAASALAIEDPFESMNRGFYAIHQGIDRALFRPLALGYSHLTAGPVGKALHNLVTELGEPVVFGNDVLQLRIKRAGVTLARFLVNATVGVGGLSDPATRMGLPYHDNGFGTTLGRWGFKPGPYIFLPLLGPTTLRDLIGTGMDFYSDPLGRIHYHDRGDVLVGVTVIGGLDLRARSEPDLKQIETMGTDSYATLRSLYLQQREAEIQGEAPVSIENLPSFDDDPAAAASPTGTTTTAPGAAELPDAPAPLPDPAAPATPPAAAPAPADPAPAAAPPAVGDASTTRSSFAQPAPRDGSGDAAYFLAPPIEL
jgi:phospholipid-binding lipoprotein MlaA